MASPREETQLRWEQPSWRADAESWIRERVDEFGLGPLRELEQVRSRAELVQACDAAVMLAQLTGVLKWELVNSGVSHDRLTGYEDVIPLRLRKLLELACA